MLAATAEGIDLARLLLDLLIIIAAARLGAELAERLNMPAVLGEIVAGVLIGPSVLELIEIEGARGVSIGIIAEIGVLLLLLQVGMEMNLTELGKVGRASMLVAIIGVVVPFAGGTFAGLALGEDGNTAIFLGAALTATSVGITARVFGDLRALATTEARVVLGAAVADDVLGLVILTVVVKIVTGGDVGFGTVAETLGLAVGFLVVTGLIGLLVVPKLLDRINAHARSAGTVVVAALVVTLAFSELADIAKLAFIIGAFMAGLGIGRSAQHERIAHDLGAVGNIFIPVFFVQIGINADLEAMVDPKVLGLAGALLVVAIVGKLVAGAGALGTPSDRLLIGLGMIPRGEVGLIFASIGLVNGVLDDDLYGALLVVVLVTTMMTPPLLRHRVGRAAPASDALDVPVEPPAEGWLEVVDDEVRLRAVPPVTSTIPIALQTAQLLSTARPSDALLRWFAAHRDDQLTWTAADTDALMPVLRDPNVRAWRLLESIAVLERGLPEVNKAVHRRRADVHDLDPVGALRFPVVEALEDLPADGDHHSDVLLLAAFAADVCEDGPDQQVCADALATHLARGEMAPRVGQLLADAHLLRAGVRDLGPFEEIDLLHLATHMASARHVREAHVLALAVGDLPKWQVEALRERVSLLLETLDHPEISGRDAANLAGARLAAASRLAVQPAAVDRLRHASVTYLLAHDPGELARQARLVEPLPRPGVVRVSVAAHPRGGLWKVDVACRDTAGLLARLTDAIAEFGLDVVSATVTTWPDGAVLDCFVVRSDERPPARELALRMEHMLREPLELLPMPELRLTFDNSSHPWHTVCLVEGHNQLGALHAVSAAFAAAGVEIHTARISSGEETISDRFTVSDRVGRKLDEAATARVRRHLAGDRSKRLLRR